MRSSDVERLPTYHMTRNVCYLATIEAVSSKVYLSVV